MAITRQKETRQQNFMKSREEFIASSITSALGGGGGGMSSQVHSAVRSQPPQQSYSRVWIFNGFMYMYNLWTFCYCVCVNATIDCTSLFLPL